MTNSPESEPKNYEIDLKKTLVFRQTLTIVDGVLNERYGMKPEQWPCLKPDSIVFLPETTFWKEYDQTNQDQESLLDRALINLGVRREEIAHSNIKQPLFANILSTPPVIYVLKEKFENLDSNRTNVWIPPAIDLGFLLIELNLLLLPDSRTLEGEEKKYWLGVLRTRIPAFFDENAYLIPPVIHDEDSDEDQEKKQQERQAKIGQAKQIFNSIIEEDESLEFVARGAQILAMVGDRRKGRQILMGFSQVFNKRVAAYLGTVPEKTLVSLLTDMYEPEAGLNDLESERQLRLMRELNPAAYHRFVFTNRQKLKEQIRRNIDQLKRDEGVSGAKGRLKQLDLSNYRRAFNAFRRSQIFSSYLEWHGKSSKIADYPLD